MTMAPPPATADEPDLPLDDVDATLNGLLRDVRVKAQTAHGAIQRMLVAANAATARLRDEQLQSIWEIESPVLDEMRQELGRYLEEATSFVRGTPALHDRMGDEVTRIVDLYVRCSADWPVPTDTGADLLHRLERLEPLFCDMTYHCGLVTIPSRVSQHLRQLRVGQRLDMAATERVLGRFLDLGMNFVDKANVYSHGTSETYLGAALARMGRRNDVVLATKCGVPMSDAPNDGGASRQHVMASVDASLQRLQTDHIDLLQMHRYDAQTPIEETLRALNDLARQGKVRYVGCSNYAAWQLTDALRAAGAAGFSPFVSSQSEYNLISRGVEAELVPVCQRFGVGFIPWAPLAAGFLTGKYRRDQARPADSRGGRRPYWFFDRWVTDHNYSRVERLEQFATDRGHTLPELALAWLLHRPAVSLVIVGASRPEQVEANARALDWKLTEHDVRLAVEAAG